MQCSGFAFFRPFLFGICDGHSGAGSFVLCFFPPPTFLFLEKNLPSTRVSAPPMFWSASQLGRSCTTTSVLSLINPNSQLNSAVHFSFSFVVAPRCLPTCLSKCPGGLACHNVTKPLLFPCLFFLTILSDLSVLCRLRSPYVAGGADVFRRYGFWVGLHCSLPALSLPACLTGWSLLPPSRSLACRYRFLVQNTAGGKGEGEGRGQDIAYPVWGGGGGVQADRLSALRGGGGDKRASLRDKKRKREAHRPK